MPCPSDCPAMTAPTKTRPRFTVLQMQEAAELCLVEGPIRRAVAQQLGPPGSILARSLLKTRIDRGDLAATEYDQHRRDERTELNRLRYESLEL